MNEEIFISATRQALMLALYLSAPALLTALAVGLLISILQAATQVHEQTVSATPKIAAVVVVIMVSAAWLLHDLVRFTAYLLGHIGDIGRGLGS